GPSSRSSDAAYRLVKQPAAHAPRQKKSLLIMAGCILATALAALIAASQLPLFESWGQTKTSRNAPGSSEMLPKRSDAQFPELLVEPSIAVAGEPAPLKMALRGVDDDAIIVIRGLPPGMELSLGGAVTADTWQLSAKELPYAWIAPPQGFAG